MRILFAEDDSALNSTLTKRLQAQGFTVDSCLDGEDALFLALENMHDLILLDCMLPNVDGRQIIKEVRANNISTPIIMLTALGSLQDKVTGLTLGADDYLVKPFAFEELLARIQCVTRRSPNFIKTENNHLSYQDMKLDLQNLILKGPNGDCSISKREGALIEEFFRNPGITLQRDSILLKVWGPDSEVETGNLDNYIHFLRRRFTTVGSKAALKTIRGLGYQLQYASA